MRAKIVAAIVGMPGSGKTTVCQMIRSRLDLPVVRFGQITIDRIRELGLPETPESEQWVREELRRDHGMAVYAERSMPRIIHALTSAPAVLLDGMYGWSEYMYLREHLEARLIVGAVVAPRAMRYERLRTRPERPLTEAQAWARDVAEIEKLEKGGPIAAADHFIVNDDTLETLRQRVDAFIDEWLRSP